MKRTSKSEASKARRRPPWKVGTQQEVADFFGKSLDTIKGEWRPKGMPGRAHHWNLAEILAWRDQRFGYGDAPPPPVEGDETRAQAERRRAIAEANLKEIRAREAAGELVPAEAVRRLFVQHVGEARAIFEQVPDRVIAALPQALKAGVRKRIHADMRRIVDDVCETLADLLAETQP
ncbi:MAG TPA: hypothetical protein VMY37_20080 [Thermoguttaceae bacterium]|nr:hypothetical protein [Thermoguttaceae bacterium]